MSWQWIAGICLMVCALLWGAYYLGGEMKERNLALAPKDTTISIVVAPHVLPKPVVTPNPAPVIIRIPADTKIVDSLILIVSDKDSLIRTLMSTKGTEQRFVSKDPTGLEVSGDLTILFSPVEDHFLTQITLDTLKVPDRVITIHEPPIIEEVTDWKGIVIAGSTGLVLGAFLFSLAGQ
jgi:hypothetical protein